MRCAQCGISINRDPIWSNGAAFCSLECAEEFLLITEENSTAEISASGIHSLFGADDDDY